MLTRLALTDFRNHADALITPGRGFILLTGDNGAGKTNILEAVSLLAPGRGLRGAPLRDMARQSGPGGFSIAARLDGEVDIGVGTIPAAPDRKKVRIKGEAAPANRLGDYLSILWLTPAMDRLFVDSAGARRRFLDRLVFALEPSHAHHVSRYEAAMRARNKLLAEPDQADADWLIALENGMAEHGAALGAARMRTIAALEEAIAASPEDDFPHAALTLSGWDGGDLQAALRASRSRDGAAGRTLVGPHRQDLAVRHRAKDQPANLSSTGEQKGLLIGLMLAHAALVEERRGDPPVLLLDEVAAHLDPVRRAALFSRLAGYGQVWMTATEAGLFDGIGEATRLTVSDGFIS